MLVDFEDLTPDTLRPDPRVLGSGSGLSMFADFRDLTPETHDPPRHTGVRSSSSSMGSGLSMLADFEDLTPCKT